MTDGSERRKYPRIDKEGPVFVKIIEATDVPALLGETLYCSTQNLSAGGLRIRVDREVPVGCTLHLWIGLSDSPGTYMLTGKVVWQRTDDDNGSPHMMGIEFGHSGNDDFEAWQSMMDQRAVE